MKIPRMSFNSGEIAPVLWWRSDLQKYGSSCEKIENYLNLPQGGVRRRFGTTLISRVSDNTDDARIIPWEVDRSTYFEMVFVGTSIKIFNANGGQIEEVEDIPWAAEDFQELYYKQSFDIMYITHPEYPPQKLSRTDGLTWVIEEFPFAPPPVGDVNPDDTNDMTFTNTGGDNFTITTVEDTFKESDIGRTIKARYQGSQSISNDYHDASQGVASGSIYAKGVVTMRTEGGLWDGRIEMQTLDPGKTEWVTIGSVTSEDGNHNGEITRDVDKVGTQARILMAQRGTATPDDTGCKWTLEVNEVQYDYYKILTYVSATEVTAERYLGSNDDKVTSEFSFGVFGEDEGYPTCVEVHEERMMFAGVLSKPATVYGSKVNVWTDFSGGTLATSSVQFTMSADVRNRTRWMSPEQSLILGTDYGEWAVGSRDGSSALSGENVVAKRHTQHGTEPVQAITASDMTLYIESGGKRLRAMQYNYTERDGYISVDMSILAPHLTQDHNLKRMTFSRSPDQIVWAIREDGGLLAFSYEREQQVSAWSRHPFSDGGQVIDLNSILTSQGDVLSLLVKRSDGLYFETITQDSLCFDWQTRYEDVDASDVLTLKGNESFKVYKDNLLEDDDAFISKTEAVYIKILTSPTDLVIKYDSEQLEENEYVDVGDNLYFLPNGEDKSLVGVFDFTTPLTEGVDYVLIYKSDCLVMDILNSTYDVDELVIKDDAVTLTEGTDYYNMSSVNQSLITNGALAEDITVEYESVELLNEDFDVFVPVAQINMSNSNIGTFYVAIEMESELRTTSIDNSGQTGGAGATTRAHEVDLFVVDSVGGNISMNDNEFEPILQPNKTVVAGERLPEYTGKIEVRTPHGYQKEGLKFSIKNNSPYNQIIASLGVQAQGYSS